MASSAHPLIYGLISGVFPDWLEVLELTEQNSSESESGITLVVLGGAGFIGGEVCQQAAADDRFCSVTAVDNLSRKGSEYRVADLQSRGINFLHADIRELDDLGCIDQADVIIDASAIARVAAGLDGRVRDLLQHNLQGTINALDLADRLNAGFIFLSTSRVYPIDLLRKIPCQDGPHSDWVDIGTLNLIGLSESGISEEFSLNGFRSFYGASKLASEHLVTEYARLKDLRCCVNRCGNVAGPWQFGSVDQGVMLHWISRHLKGEPLRYIGFGGQGLQCRDYLHVSDLAELLILQSCTIDQFSGETFNVGGGAKNLRSLRQLTKEVSSIVGQQIQIKSEPHTNPVDIPFYCSNNSRIIRRCNWTPSRTVTDILHDSVEWFRLNPGLLKSHFS